MQIERIHNYQDGRFPKEILWEHGAFLVDGNRPCMFKIKDQHSATVFFDDYTDILLGARIDAENHPTYNGKYWDNGYPPSDIGVCTDVIWRAFKNAGYNLRAMIDQDIKTSNEQDYHIKTPDSNIDFRRVGNLYVFFHKYAESLTLDISKIEEWQPGNIVVFGSMKHIGIISDKRNKNGEPFLIHNSGQPFREENVLRKLAKKDGITGHFRWDASKIEDIIILWEEK